MKSIHYIALLSALLIAIQLTVAMELELPPEAVEGVNIDYDYESLQGPKKGPGEVEMDAYRDSEFDREITEEKKRPPNPTDEEVEDLNRQKEGLLKEAAEARIDLNRYQVTKHPYIALIDKYQWIPNLRCCPRKWNYECLHVNMRMSCFTNYHNYRREICCPLYPTIMMARCVCDKCHILANECVQPGNCGRYYTSRTFLAGCHNGRQWTFRMMKKLVPTKCFCRAERPQIDSCSRK